MSIIRPKKLKWETIREKAEEIRKEFVTPIELIPVPIEEIIEFNSLQKNTHLSILYNGTNKDINYLINTLPKPNEKLSYLDDSSWKLPVPWISSSKAKTRQQYEFFYSIGIQYPNK